MRAPSMVNVEYFGSRPPIRTAVASTSGVVERNAGHGLHELAHVTHGQRAEVVGGDHVLGIHGSATFHDGAGLAFTLRRDDHHVQLVRTAACIGVGRHAQLEIQRDNLIREDGDRSLRLLQAGVSDDDGDARRPAHC